MFFWSTGFDAPHTKIKSYEEMKKFIIENESGWDRDIWLNKLERVRVHGVSYGTDSFKADKQTKMKSKRYRKDSVLDLIHNNRAGELLKVGNTEKPLSLNKIIKFYTETCPVKEPIIEID